MDKQIAVIGLGVFGSEVALSLMKRRFAVLAVDEDAQAVDVIKERVTQAMQLDSTQEQALLEAGIQEMDTVVVAIGTSHVENSILTTALLRQIGVKYIVARAISPLHERILRQVGAHEVVNPEREMGAKVANKIARPGFLEMFPLADDLCVVELPVPASFVGHSLEELNVRKRFNINVLAVQRLCEGQSAPTNLRASATPKPEHGTRRLIMAISPNNDRFRPDDIVLAMGHQDALSRLVSQN